MNNLLRKEEKLLRRLFSKRQQELLGYIGHIEKRTNVSAENAKILIDKHNREIFELKKLERKLVGIVDEKVAHSR